MTTRRLTRKGPARPLVTENGHLTARHPPPPPSGLAGHRPARPHLWSPPAVCGRLVRHRAAYSSPTLAGNFPRVAIVVSAAPGVTKSTGRYSWYTAPRGGKCEMRPIRVISSLLTRTSGSWPGHSMVIVTGSLMTCSYRVGDCCVTVSVPDSPGSSCSMTIVPPPGRAAAARNPTVRNSTLLCGSSGSTLTRCLTPPLKSTDSLLVRMTREESSATIDMGISEPIGGSPFSFWARCETAADEVGAAVAAPSVVGKAATASKTVQTASTRRERSDLARRAEAIQEARALKEEIAQRTDAQRGVDERLHRLEQELAATGRFGRPALRGSERVRAEAAHERPLRHRAEIVGELETLSERLRRELAGVTGPAEEHGAVLEELQRLKRDRTALFGVPSSRTRRSPGAPVRRQPPHAAPRRAPRTERPHSARNCPGVPGMKTVGSMTKVGPPQRGPRRPMRTGPHGSCRRSLPPAAPLV